MGALKDWILDKLAQFVATHKPERLNQLVRAEVQRLASEVSVRTAMQYLDKQGFLHCGMCAQRFGLQRTQLKNEAGETKEVYLCSKHYAQSGAARTNAVVTV